MIRPSSVLPSGVISIRPVPSERQPWIELGWPGYDPKLPCLDMISFDSSGSVTAARGNDPVGNRFREAANAIKLVAEWSTSGRSKVAVLHFDHPIGASDVLPLNDKRLMQRLEPALQPPGGPGSSELGPSLGAMERLAAAHPDHDIRATIFSDFELMDVNPGEVFSRLADFPGNVHAVVLGGNPPLDLLDVDNITVTALSSQDPPGAFAAAIHRSLTATRRGRRYSVLHGTRGAS